MARKKVYGEGRKEEREKETGSVGCGVRMRWLSKENPPQIEEIEGKRSHKKMAKTDDDDGKDEARTHSHTHTLSCLKYVGRIYYQKYNHYPAITGVKDEQQQQQQQLCREKLSRKTLHAEEKSNIFHKHPSFFPSFSSSFSHSLLPASFPPQKSLRGAAMSVVSSPADSHHFPHHHYIQLFSEILLKNKGSAQKGEEVEKICHNFPLKRSRAI